VQRLRPSERLQQGERLQPGGQFEKDGTVYQMFRIYESVSESGSNVMAIFIAYFDKLAADEDGKTLEDFLKLPRRHEDTNFEGVHPDYLIVSYHDEVMQWIQKATLG
jgi:hypothetical protein